MQERVKERSVHSKETPQFMSGAQSLEVMLILLVFLAEQVISMSGFFPLFYLSLLFNIYPLSAFQFFFFSIFCRISQVKVLQKLEVQFPLVMMKTSASYLGQNLPLRAEVVHQQLLSTPMMLLNMVKVKLVHNFWGNQA